MDREKDQADRFSFGLATRTVSKGGGSSARRPTAQSIRELLSGAAEGTKLIVVSNREPVIHEQSANGIRAVRPASGMVAGLEPLVRAVRGVWVAHGSGPADRQVVDRNNRVGIPSERPEYMLRRVWLTRQEESGYYYGLANGAIWPLCHIVHTRPVFRRSDWEDYRSVNRKFADAVLQEAGDQPAIVFIQDFHLALLPRMLRQSKADLTIAQFWHIPWPNREAFRIFPWGEELLDGMLGNDLLGFHIQYHCNNFLDTVDRGIEGRVDYEHFRIFRGGHPTMVRPFPISVDAEQIGSDVRSAPVRNRMAELETEYGNRASGKRFIVGVDRIDYTKGICERLRSFDLMLKEHPEYCGAVTFLNFCAPSRLHVEAYRDLNDQIDDLVDEINWRHQTDDWMPIRFLRHHHDYPTVLAAYLLADVLIVSSLHDGMNLVAKEFVASRSDEQGVLILSQYTGAARELTDALLVNPYDIEQVADQLHRALSMPVQEQQTRMTRLRAVVQGNDIYHWGASFLGDIRFIREQVTS